MQQTTQIITIEAYKSQFSPETNLKCWVSGTALPSATVRLTERTVSRRLVMGCLMKNGIATHDSLSEYFVLQINGRTDSIHRRYEDAVRAGLLLKNIPHVAIKVREVDSIGEVAQATPFH